MSSEQPLPKQSEAQDGVRWMGGKETRGVATCAAAAAAGSTPAAAAAAASRGPKHRAAAAAGSTPATAAAASRGPKRRAAESRGCGRGLLAGNYGRNSAARGRRSVPPPPPRCPPGHGGGGSKLGPKRRAAESRGCDRRPWAGNCGRSSAARGSVQIAKRAAAPNHASRPRRMPSGAPYRWAHPSNTEHAPGGEGGPGCPGQSGPPSSKRRPVCVLNE